MTIFVDGYLPIQNAVVTNFTTAPFVVTDGMKKITGEMHENGYSACATVVNKVVPVTIITHVTRINNIVE